MFRMNISNIYFRYDSLSIYDSNGSNLTLSGYYEYPQTVTSENSTLELTFVSDYSVSSAGFRIQYKFRE